jgi:hypothetical protein
MRWGLRSKGQCEVQTAAPVVVTEALPAPPPAPVADASLHMRVLTEVSDLGAPAGQAMGGRCQLGRVLTWLHGSALEAEAAPPDRPRPSRAPALTPRPFDTPQLYEFQQQLALVNENPLLGLPEAADLLAKHLDADLAA